MKTHIGDTAGRIWDTLKDNERIGVSKLPKMLKEREVIVYQALGWLAREDKIAYEVKGKQTFVSLSNGQQ